VIRASALAFAVCALFLTGPAAGIELSVVNAWIRSAPEGQTSTPAYMDVRSDTPVRLVGATSPWAEKINIRSVELEDGTGVERTLPGLDIPPGETRLAPGGHHLSLMGIRRGFGNGDFVPITLHFEDAARVPHTVDVEAQARGMSAPRPRP
jgi:periplasmic copper chaperone A